MIAPSRADDVCTRRSCILRLDLRRGIGHGKHDGFLIHGPDHVLRYDVSGGYTDQDIGTCQRILQGPGPARGVEPVDQGALPAGQLHVRCQDPLPVHQNDIFLSPVQKQPGNGTSRTPGTVDDDPRVLFFRQLQGIFQRGRHHNCRAVLVIMEYRNVQLFLQAPLHFKTPRCRDVLQVDAAKGRCQGGNHIHQPVCILGVQHQRDGVQAGESLEQHTFSLHHRHPGFRADVAKPQHRRTVGDHRNGVTPAGVDITQGRIPGNLQTGRCHTRCIGYGEIVGCFNGHLVHCFQLALPLPVFFQRLARCIHQLSLPFMSVFTMFFIVSIFCTLANSYRP